MFCYSFDGETFYGESAETFEEAVEESKQDWRYESGERKSVFIGEDFPYRPQIWGERVIEELQENAMEEIGESAETYLEDVTHVHEKELSNILTDAFNKWAKDNGYEPSFWGVHNIKEYVYE